MKNLKSTFTALVMMFVIAFGTTFANAGIIIAAREGGDCKTSATKKTDDTMNTGIIIAYTGIIIAYTGIIIALKGEEAPAPCESKESAVGIIIA